MHFPISIAFDQHVAVAISTEWLAPVILLIVNLYLTDTDNFRSI